MTHHEVDAMSLAALKCCALARRSSTYWRVAWYSCTIRNARTPVCLCCCEILERDIDLITSRQISGPCERLLKFSRETSMCVRVLLKCATMEEEEEEDLLIGYLRKVHVPNIVHQRLSWVKVIQRHLYVKGTTIASCCAGSH